jgi:ring-1,2-phenylacetyl-CoA epoxidase subunit PaaD
MVTADQVWAALGELPDPEIPVVSLVELGVVRDVRVDGAQVCVTLTPTFLGCPALEAMQRALEVKLAELGAEPVVEIDRGDSWTTDSITPAGREKLRASGPTSGVRAEARPAPVGRVPLPVLRVDRDAAGEHLRPDAVPVDSLLRELPAAVRAVQDHLSGGRRPGAASLRSRDLQAGVGTAIALARPSPASARRIGDEGLKPFTVQ